MIAVKKRLHPVRHAWVKRSSNSAEDRFGQVQAVVEQDGRVVVKVKWFRPPETAVVPLEEVRCGLLPGMAVQDLPESRTRATLGMGTVLKIRHIGGRDQALVDFPESGRIVWMPYEILRPIKDTRRRFSRGDLGPEDSAERFRLRSLAHALEMWNENTGSLSHLEIDPLPHQIHLVHHILLSGSLNWLIADDVGLGKTIETGMLLAALKQRGSLRRVLLVTPAGLTKQWQEELSAKFNMDDFRIFGEDFHINEQRHWRMYDHVIASLDRLKTEENLRSILGAGPWDLIVFDEAHKLTRRQFGLKRVSSQRFQLAARLRKRTHAIILLTGTPHQGMPDKFQALLELLRPEMKKEIQDLSAHPELIGQMVFRNNKADVTDANGHFLFKGKTTKAIRVELSEEARAFDQMLQKYLARGYEAGARLGDQGRAIGFVMTVYRKLAASSVAAIHNALLRRRQRLLDSAVPWERPSVDITEQDNRFRGEWEERSAEDNLAEFFVGEQTLLDQLIDKAERLRKRDRKLQQFMDSLLQTILARDPNEKILIFTEYRSTQEYLQAALTSRFGDGSVVLINGSIPHAHRREAIARFKTDSQFMISTEAGGEGINLHDKCHILINYDLPWNPMRLVQRIGRLYRYGQTKRVVVMNMHSPNTVDEKIIELMYTRINQVVHDLANVSSEFNERLQEDILGQMVEMLDVEQILAQATIQGIARTHARIEDALTRARQATAKQRELFEYAASFDPIRTRDELRVGQHHAASFVEGMFKQLQIEIVNKTNRGSVWDIRLPEEVTNELGVKKSRYLVTFDRALAAARPERHMLDLNSFLMRYLLNKAKQHDFLGQTAVIASEELNGVAIFTAMLRWQNDQGDRIRQEFVALQVRTNGVVEMNPDAFSAWLAKPATTASIREAPARTSNDTWLHHADIATQQRLQDVSNRYLHPRDRQWISAGWVRSADGRPRSNEPP